MSEVLIYESENGQTRVDVRLEAETVWLTQEQMATLFGRERSVVTKHLRNVFKEQELDEKSNVQNLHIAGSDRPVKFYNLDVVISVGYRVKSQRGVQFRQWATRTLREHLVQGYTLNSSRLAERGITEAQQAIELLARTLLNDQLTRHSRAGGNPAHFITIAQHDNIGHLSALRGVSFHWIPACAGMTRHRLIAHSGQVYLLAGGQA